MTVQMELWQLIVLLLAFFGCVFTFGTVLLKQINKRLDERYETQETARTEAQRRWDEQFRRQDEHSRKVELDLMKLRAQLPNEYVRREDWIRFSGQIDSKLDKIYQRIDTLKESRDA